MFAYFCFAGYRQIEGGAAVNQRGGSNMQHLPGNRAYCTAAVKIYPLIPPGILSLVGNNKIYLVSIDQA